MSNIDLTYDHDLKFEWIASYVVSHYPKEFAIDQLIIQPIGIFGRHVNHDVETISIVERKLKKYLEFKINRDGIYDNLPQGLFHVPLSTKQFSDTISDTRTKIKAETRNENQARDYFHVFEQELLVSNLVIQSLVLDIEKKDYGFANSQLTQLLSFDITSFTKDERDRILALLPYKNSWNNNLHEILSLFMNHVLDVNIEVNLLCKHIQVKSMSTTNTLGSHCLDWDLCIGDHIEQLQHIAIIKVVDIRNGDENKIVTKKIEGLMHWLLPSNYQHEIIYECNNYIIKSLAEESAILN